MKTMGLQLEKMRAPFGVREAMEAGGRPSLDLAVSSEKLKAFCEQLDENNIKNATDNSEAMAAKACSMGALRPP